ncbi:selenocysteine-specific translation elongation factor [Salirhabdus sp. Marseille-P4669]|uniref:selenocysteine-specific translation elongation factor n=1 Tax=Salirhabdus sp. Marseille-P4669 TaxID=2042310 RepID=UPI000C7BD534|nr:selenocysteine-specific translation elongation factor [Salirhabdus sp. Marseille-P4669]
MNNRSYTIGMAGHIDHGKTSLTKALTNVDTDRLKEEKERKISIELGFAPLKLKDSNYNISIIDVPGHEKFIRQMIAGVAGIDLVLIIIAADEGIMPQTVEHMNILSLLNIHNAIIVITKVKQAEAELIDLVENDIKEFIKQTTFADAPIVQVDSIDGVGIEGLKQRIMDQLNYTKHRNELAPFRLPIDQVFTMKGVGTIVRGTIYEGTVHVEDQLVVLPNDQKGKARQIQVHSHSVNRGFAGQRTAIQLAGVHKDDVKRGDVLVKQPEFFTTTTTIDVAMRFINPLKTPIKQRTPIKLHTGTNEVYGHIIFFDRNKVEKEMDEIVCQIRLKEPIVIKREDRFILRRATPVETIGGGWVINPNGEKYKFGEETITKLTQMKEGTPEEQVLQLISRHNWITKEELVKKIPIDLNQMEEMVHRLSIDGTIKKIANYYTLTSYYEQIQNEIIQVLNQFHDENPMKTGMNKPELLKHIEVHKSIQEMLIKQWIGDKKINQKGHYIAINGFEPHLPTKWETRMLSVLDQLKADQLKVKEWKEYVKGLPMEFVEPFHNYLIEQEIITPLMENYMIHTNVWEESVALLRQQTEATFTLKEAKDILKISRKYLIPFLERLDKRNITIRIEDKRKWV